MSKENSNNQDKTVEFIIPTLNEEAAIREVIRHIRSQNLTVEYSITVTDGGSTDKTISICSEEGVKVLQRREKGKGTGMREAVEQSSADILVFIDGDNTYRVDEMDKFLQPLLGDKADMVIGSRITGEREKGSITPFNLLGNKIFNKIINFALKTKITDSQSAVRACTRKMFSNLFLSGKNFDIEVELTTEALAQEYRVVEYPIKYINRQNSVPKLDPISDGGRIARMLFFIVLNYKPLTFFGIFSLIIFGIAAYPAGLVLYEKIVLGDIIHIPAVVLAAVLIVTAVLMLVLGILAELIVRSRRMTQFWIQKTKPLNEI